MIGKSGHFIIEKVVVENFMSVKKYAVNIANIVRNLQMKVYEKILAKTHSPHHVRIFRILMKFHSLDDKKVVFSNKGYLAFNILLEIDQRISYDSIK